MPCLLSTLSFLAIPNFTLLYHVPVRLSSPRSQLFLCHSPSPKRGEHASMSTERERLDEIGKKIKREPDPAAIAGVVVAVSPTEHHVHRRLGPGIGGAVNIATPCAACKLLRRRCAHECPFAPYFSPHEPHKFAAVHKVFGASNVSKMLLVPEAERADAASSLVYEANLRLRDPVYGCMGAISMLQQQVNALEAELEAVRAEIFKHRYRQAGVGVGVGAANLIVDDGAAAAGGFMPPSTTLVHTADVVSVAEAGQEVATLPATPTATAYAAGQPSSADYSSLNTSEHDAYFG
ncbi:LOB domain-containing protein 15-like isoform X2 [Hordeum vulgare subsp. vulgare]|uniref:LOB domain-containing protein 15-like isoform X2 n=1 Tax=Hordeum vulgare subsp. vulgare TaxID=112509 RepID=UPI001D1A3CAC|nr:LOB domain-containing protein 15-like isoform X2 [Hordeum vulgare subsp. vulgare]